MTNLARRDDRGPLGEMFDWLETPWTAWRPFTGHPIRMEDYVDDGSYVVRAELPGLDPEKDIEVTISDGMLTVRAERREENGGKHHSEFRYGSFSRSITLPTGADDEHVDAVYGHGILEVTIRLADKDKEEAVKKVPVRENQHIKPT